MVWKYAKNGIAAAALASMLGCTSPNLQANCTEPEQVKKLIPDYNLENAVANADMHSKLDRIIGDYYIKAGAEYFLIIYNSKSKNNKIIEYGSSEEFEQFLKRGEFDVIEFYEMNNLEQIHNRPSAVIYKNGNIAYAVFDLAGPFDLADGIFDASICFAHWEPNLLTKAGDLILKKRLNDTIERDPPPQNPKPSVWHNSQK